LTRKKRGLKIFCTGQRLYRTSPSSPVIGNLDNTFNLFVDCRGIDITGLADKMHGVAEIAVLVGVFGHEIIETVEGRIMVRGFFQNMNSIMKGAILGMDIGEIYIGIDESRVKIYHVIKTFFRLFIIPVIYPLRCHIVVIFRFDVPVVIHNHTCLYILAGYCCPCLLIISTMTGGNVSEKITGIPLFQWPAIEYNHCTFYTPYRTW